MRLDRDMKIVRMIPLQRGSTTGVSAATAGSGGHGTLGIVDTRGYNRCRVEVIRSTGAGKLTSVLLAFQSGAATLFASALTGGGSLTGTSGRVLNSTTATSFVRAFDINLAAHPARKRYLNCRIGQSLAASRSIAVHCILYQGETFPPAITGYTGFTTIGS